MDGHMSYAVKVIRPDEAERAVTAMVQAFEGDPAVRWSYPEHAEYVHHFPQFVRAFGKPAFAGGTAYQVDDFAGVAIWLPPGVDADQDELIAVFANSLPPEQLSKVMSVFERMAEFHPEAPHWYLPLLGVRPEHQSQGLGSALLKHVLEECDRTHVAAYLESSNVRNIPLYQRHGFEVLGTIQAGTSPSISPMLRGAR